MKIQPLRSEVCMDQVIEQYATMVYRLAVSYTGNRADGEDVFQEVFLRLVQREEGFTEEAHRKAWLIRVTINCCKTFLGSSWNQKTVALGEEKEGSTVVQLEEEGALFYALQKLPCDYKTVIHLFYFEDMPTKDIAKTLHLFETTVRSRLSRGRKLLKQFLEEEGQNG